jgi:hypothetical protein
MTGTWQGAGDSGTVQLSQQSGNPQTPGNPSPSGNQTFSGSFSGRVQDIDANGLGDQGLYESYGGPMTATLTANSGGGDQLQLSGDLQEADASYDDGEFSTSLDGTTVTVSNLGNIAFSFSMGNGTCQAQGSISNGVFSGTWTFYDSSDGDNGSGSFRLTATG